MITTLSLFSIYDVCLYSDYGVAWKSPENGSCSFAKRLVLWWRKSGTSLMQVQKYDLWLYVPRIMPLNFLLWVFVVALRKRYSSSVVALWPHCCCVVARCRRRVVGTFLNGVVWKKLLGGIWCCPTPKKASVEDIFARKGGLYAIYLHKDFVAVQINCTFAADFTN